MSLKSNYQLTSDDFKILESALMYLRDPNEHYVENICPNPQYRKKLDVLKQMVKDMEAESKVVQEYLELVIRIQKAGFTSETTGTYHIGGNCGDRE